MNMRKLTLAVVVTAAASAGIVGCHDSKDRTDSVTTDVDVFDGYALECTVVTNDLSASELGNGGYRFTDTEALPTGAVISATTCVDADTGLELHELKGVAQEGGAAVSPITTLIVSAAIAQGGDPANITADVLTSVTNTIVTNLGLGTYNPISPSTANYVDTVGSSTTSQAIMQTALAISTLLTTVEKAAGTTSAEAAVTAVARAVAAATAPINLESTTAVQAVMTSAASLDSSVATAINTASTAVAEKVADIASADSIGEAAAITQAIATVLNNDSAPVTSVADVDTDDLPPIDVGVVTDPDTGSTGGTGGTGG